MPQQPSGRRTCPGPSRRDLLVAGSLTFLSAMTGGSAQARPVLTRGPAKACIFMFMWGGPSQLDTWDLKPEAPADVRGEFRPIATSVPGIQICEHFPRLARLTDRLAIIRSLTHDDPAHLSSVHHLMTGHRAARFPSDADPPSRKDWPHLASLLARLRPTPGPLPPFVTLPWTVMHPAAPGGVAPGQNGGWLGPGGDPFVIQGDPNAATFGISGLRLPGNLTPEQFAARRDLRAELQRQASIVSQWADGQHFHHLQGQAFDLLADSTVHRAFDLSRETPRTRDRYGRNIHGQSVLLARRLVEAGVPFVGVNWHQDHRNFWDTHGDNFNRLKRDLMPPTDLAFSALIEDLEQRGLLDSTLLVWVGEFGRRPQITAGNAGREHWPHCYCGVLAGGGIRGGIVHGRSDRMAARPVEAAVSPPDLTATMYHALGIDPGQMVQSRDGRPVPLTEGRPILPLLETS